MYKVKTIVITFSHGVKYKMVPFKLITWHQYDSFQLVSGYPNPTNQPKSLPLYYFYGKSKTTRKLSSLILID